MVCVTPLTHNSSSLNNASTMGTLTMAIILLTTSAAALMPGEEALAAKAEWPEGWSGPVLIARSSRFHGFRASSDQNHLWIVTVDEPEGALRLWCLPPTGKEPAVVAETEVEGRLVDYDVASTGTTIYLSWAEENGNSSCWYKSYDLKGQESTAKTLIWSTPKYIDSLDMAAGEGDSVAIAWAGMGESGGYRIHLKVMTVQGRVIADTIRVSEAGRTGRAADTLPQIAVDGAGLVHCSYYRLENESGAAIYTQYNPTAGETGPVLVLGPSSMKNPFAALPVPHHSGDTAVLMPLGTSSRGVYRQQEPACGLIDSHGNWIDEWRAVTTRPGFTGSISATPEGEGAIFLTWLEGVNQVRQVAYSIYEPKEGRIIREGPVTVGEGHHFAPRALMVGQNRIILFYQYDGLSGIDVYLVNQLTPAEPPLAFRLGLDPAHPFLDGLVRIIYTGISAVAMAALASLAVGAVVIAVTLGNRIGIFPRQGPGAMARFAVAIGLMALLKQTNGYLYFGAQFLPGLPGLLTVLGSAGLTLGVIYVMSNLDREDTLTLAAAAYLFVFCDSFATLLVKGLVGW